MVFHDTPELYQRGGAPLTTVGPDGRAWLTGAGLAAGRMLMRVTGCSADEAVNRVLTGPAPERYARPQPPAWSAQTEAWLDARLRERRAAALDTLAAEQHAQEQYVREVAQLDVTLAYSRSGYSWDESVRLARSPGAVERYMAAPPPEVHTERPDESGYDEADRETERAEAILQLAKMIEQRGFSFDDARRMARAEGHELTRAEREVVGICPRADGRGKYPESLTDRRTDDRITGAADGRDDNPLGRRGTRRPQDRPRAFPFA
jgi:hypothetical protein